MNRIEIRKIERKDTENIIKWRNSQHVMNVFIDRNQLTEKIHNDWLTNYVDKGYVDQFVIHDQDKNVDFGSVFLKNINAEHKKAEIGIFIGEEDYLGKGYGPIALKLLINHGFNDLNLNKIYARVLEFNKRSYNTFVKLGFSMDACLREDVIINGKAENVCIFSILKKEWGRDE